jgi:hypothetical protein
MIALKMFASYLFWNYAFMHAMSSILLFCGKLSYIQCPLSILIYFGDAPFLITSVFIRVVAYSIVQIF